MLPTNAKSSKSIVPFHLNSESKKQENPFKPEYWVGFKDSHPLSDHVSLSADIVLNDTKVGALSSNLLELSYFQGTKAGERETKPPSREFGPSGFRHTETIPEFIYRRQKQAETFMETANQSFAAGALYFSFNFQETMYPTNTEGGAENSFLSNYENKNTILTTKSNCFPMGDHIIPFLLESLNENYKPVYLEQKVRINNGKKVSSPASLVIAHKETEIRNHKINIDLLKNVLREHFSLEKIDLILDYFQPYIITGTNEDKSNFSHLFLNTHFGILDLIKNLVTKEEINVAIKQILLAAQQGYFMEEIAEHTPIHTAFIVGDSNISTTIYSYDGFEDFKTKPLLDPKYSVLPEDPLYKNSFLTLGIGNVYHMNDCEELNQVNEGRDDSKPTSVWNYYAGPLEHLHSIDKAPNFQNPDVLAVIHFNPEIKTAIKTKRLNEIPVPIKADALTEKLGK